MERCDSSSSEQASIALSHKLANIPVISKSSINESVKSSTCVFTDIFSCAASEHLWLIIILRIGLEH